MLYNLIYFLGGIIVGIAAHYYYTELQIRRYLGYDPRVRKETVNTSKPVSNNLPGVEDDLPVDADFLKERKPVEGGRGFYA